MVSVFGIAIMVLGIDFIFGYLDSWLGNHPFSYSFHALPFCVGSLAVGDGPCLGTWGPLD